MSRRWLKKWWLVGSFLLLATVVTIMAFFLSAPSHGKLTSVDVMLRPVKTQPAAKLAPASTLANKYFSLDLPSGYNLTAQSATTSGLLWNATIIKSAAAGSQVISISLKNFSGNLNDDSSYRLRQQSSGYRLQSLSLDGQTIPVFISVGGSGEAVAFWSHGAYLATVSVSQYAATDSTDCLQTLNTLLSAWRWPD